MRKYKQLIFERRNYSYHLVPHAERSLGLTIPEAMFSAVSNPIFVRLEPVISQIKVWLHAKST